LLQGKGACFVETCRYDFRDVLDAIAIAETYSASARLTHGGSIPQDSLLLRLGLRALARPFYTTSLTRY
jgi:hypothetical protein